MSNKQNWHSLHFNKNIHFTNAKKTHHIDNKILKKRQQRNRNKLFTTKADTK